MILLAIDQALITSVPIEVSDCEEQKLQLSNQGGCSDTRPETGTLTFLWKTVLTFCITSWSVFTKNSRMNKVVGPGGRVKLSAVRIFLGTNLSLSASGKLSLVYFSFVTKRPTNRWHRECDTGEPRRSSLLFTCDDEQPQTDQTSYCKLSLWGLQSKAASLSHLYNVDCASSAALRLRNSCTCKTSK